MKDKKVGAIFGYTEVISTQDIKYLQDVGFNKDVLCIHAVKSDIDFINGEDYECDEFIPDVTEKEKVYHLKHLNRIYNSMLKNGVDFIITGYSNVGPVKCKAV